MSWKTSDPKPIYDDLDAMADLFDFTKNDLGESATEIQVETVLDAMNAEVDCDGIPWADLSASYEEWKSKVAPGQPIGVLYGHMKTVDQLEGEQDIRPKLIEHTYGTDDIARTEALKFQLGGLVTGTNQPQRHFWGFNWAGVWKLNQLFDSVFHRAF